MDGDIDQVLARSELERVIGTADLAIGVESCRHETGKISVVPANLGAIRPVPGNAEDEVFDRIVDTVVNTKPTGASTRHKP
jgi:hypothetical protein